MRKIKRFYMFIGFLFIFFSLYLFNFEKISLIKDNLYSDIEFNKYREMSVVENKKNESESKEEITDSKSEDVTDSYDDDSVLVDVVVSEVDKENRSTAVNSDKNFIGYLEIDKINLHLGFVSKDSVYNDVSKNIQLLDKSDYPDKENGVVIIAGHSGSGPLAYFKDLHKLELNDKVNIYYNNTIYTYNLVDIYNVLKTGTVRIKKTSSKGLVLITCTYNDKTSQTVYIFEDVNSGDNNE